MDKFDIKKFSFTFPDDIQKYDDLITDLSINDIEFDVDKIFKIENNKRILQSVVVNVLVLNV